MPNSAWNFEPLNPVAKKQCIEKLLLLNLTGDTDLYGDKALKNSVHHAGLSMACCRI